jgi:carbonic anhydrase/acetyltransferase-like protein (isoleucine patch superfamily)
LRTFSDFSSAPMSIETYRDFTPLLGRNVYVHPAATVIGDVDLGDEVSVWPGAVIRGDVNRIRIGARSNVQDGSILHVSHRRPADPDGAPLLIGGDVTIGHAVILHGCVIGDECLVGMGSLVMDKAVLEPRVLLGAGSLVPEGRVLRSGWLHLGRPARPVRPLSPEELEHFAYQAANYARLAAEYR